MNEWAILGLLVLLFVGVPWLLSVVLEGGVAAVGDAAAGRKARQSATTRELTTTLPPEHALHLLHAGQHDLGWTVSALNPALVATTYTGVPVRITTGRANGKTRLVIEAPEEQLVGLSGQVLALLRTSDPGVRVKPRRA